MRKIKKSLLVAMCSLLLIVPAAQSEPWDDFEITHSEYYDTVQELEQDYYPTEYDEVITAPRAVGARPMAAEQPEGRMMGAGRARGDGADVARAAAIPAGTAGAARSASAIAANVGSGNIGGTCRDRDNPFIVWADRDTCQIERCTGADLILVGADGNNPRCLQRCRIFGGTATRVWDAREHRWGICGGGDQINCTPGFIAVNKQTSASGVAFRHCIPVGARTGACAEDGRTHICNIPGGRAQQRCENGFWGQCTAQRMCDAGLVQGNSREIYTVIGGTDRQTSMFDCVPR